MSKRVTMTGAGEVRETWLCRVAGCGWPVDYPETPCAWHTPVETCWTVVPTAEVPALRERCDEYGVTIVHAEPCVVPVYDRHVWKGTTSGARCLLRGTAVALRLVTA